MGKIHILAGTPAVGKTTIGRLVASKLNMDFLELRDLAGVDVGCVEVDARSLSARAGAIAKRKIYDLMLATHIVFKPRGVEVGAVVVIRKRPDELLRDLRIRGYPEDKVLENVEAELLGIVYADALRIYGDKVSQIIVSGKDIRECVELVGRCVVGDRIREEVDWMTELDKLQLLDELLTKLSRRSKTGLNKPRPS